MGVIICISISDLAGGDRLQVAVGELPIDQVPPGGQILGAVIAIINVIRMLPDITSQNRVSKFLYKKQQQQPKGVVQSHKNSGAGGVSGGRGAAGSYHEGDWRHRESGRS